MFVRVLSVALSLLALAPAAQAELVITMGGDVNFNKNRQLPEASGVRIGGQLVSFESMTAGIRHLINGDLNFANIETVVTDRRDLNAQDKTFAFQTHPEALRHLGRMGFNLLSLANNHSYDYGFAGLSETELNIRRLQQEFPAIQAHGIGRTREEAARPVVFTVQGVRVAFSAIGIIDPSFRPKGGSPGVLSYRDEADFALLLRMMRETTADLKIISFHFGTEGQVTLDAGQRQRFERAIDEGGVDLVIGHHPHVVRPVQMHNGKIIMYSLGNYVMAGAASLDGRKTGYGYGLFARLYFDKSTRDGRQQIQAMEVIALQGMSRATRPMSPEAGAQNIRFLSDLGRQQVGDRAVTFNVREDGTGLACQPEAVLGRAWGPRAAAVCGRSGLSLR